MSDAQQPRGDGPNFDNLKSALAPHQPDVSDVVKKAQDAGVPFLDVLMAILTNPGTAAIIQAILTLISRKKQATA